MADFSVHDALCSAQARLSDAGIASAGIDAPVLLAHALGIEREQLLLSGHDLLSKDRLITFDSFIARRVAHEPVAYITGKKEFWSLDFYVTPDTLIPRPDSETLVEAALRRVQNRARPIKILDIGTGTGCLLIALLKELPSASGTGVDVSEKALKTAGRNAERHGVTTRVQLIKSNWCDVVQGTFDLVISNPPYINAAEMHTLMPDVRLYEPHLALEAGSDGLDAYRAIIHTLKSRMADDAMVLLEVGAGQAKPVAALLRDEGFRTEAVVNDYAGIGRCVIGHIN